MTSTSYRSKRPPTHWSVLWTHITCFSRTFMFTSDTSVLLLMCVIVFLHCGTGLVTGYFFHHHKGTVKGHCEHHNIMKSRYRQCQYLLINIPGVFFVLFCFSRICVCFQRLLSSCVGITMNHHWLSFMSRLSAAVILNFYSVRCKIQNVLPWQHFSFRWHIHLYWG